MSDRVVQSYHDGDARAGQSSRAYQSVWMAHWTRTSCRAAPQVHNHMSLHLNNNDNHDANKHPLLSGLEVAADISPSAEGFTEVTELRTIRIMNEGPTSSKDLIHERSDSLPFPMFKLRQNISGGLDPKIDQGISCHRQVPRPHSDCKVEYNAHATVSHCPSLTAVAPGTETSSRTSPFEGVSQSPQELPKHITVVGDGGLPLAGPSHENYAGSTSLVPYKSKKGKTPMSLSLMGRQEEANQLSSVLASKEKLSSTGFTPLGQEHHNDDNHSASFVCKKKQNDYSTSMRPVTSQLKRKSVQDLLTGNYHLPMLVKEHSQKVQNPSTVEFFPVCSKPLDTEKSVKPYHGCYSVQRIEGAIHDVENMRICATNSEGLGGGPGAFSQTTHSFLFMKQTDVNFSKKSQTFRESGVSKKLKGNIISEVLNFTAPLGQNQQRAKLQPLSSSSESDKKDNIEHVEISEVHLKNESSADTATMDIDGFKDQNYHSGVNSALSNKDMLSVTPIPSTKEVRCRLSITALPDMNEEIPALAASPMDHTELSASRTESLDAEHLLSHSEQPVNTKPNNHQPNSSPTQEPSSRWLKRLRLNASNSFAHGTKSSTLGEFSSHEKVNKLFNKIMKGAKSSGSEPLVNQNAMVLWNGGSSSTDSVEKHREKLLSHSWIRRWCHDQTAACQKKAGGVVICEPESTKVELVELQNKQFPSIGAMALMGKALNGFQPCEFQKRGSFVVWNTKGS